MSISEVTAESAGFLHDADAEARYFADQRFLRWRKRLLPVVTFFGFLCLWQAVIVAFEVKAFVAPAPTAVMMYLVQNAGMLAYHLGFTATEAIAGFLIGNLTAAIVAIAFVYRRTLEEAFFPVAVIINTIPVVAKAPILILLLGHGMAPKVAISALICFFPMLVNMTRGLRDVAPEQMELMRILCATPREVFTRVRMQNSIPYMFAALKVTASTSVIGAIVGEWVGATQGLGALIIDATVHYESPMLYATVVVGSVFSGAFFFFVCWLERVFLSWKVERE